MYRRRRGRTGSGRRYGRTGNGRRYDGDGNGGGSDGGHLWSRRERSRVISIKRNGWRKSLI